MISQIAIIKSLQQQVADLKATVGTDAAAKAAAFDTLIDARKSQLEQWANGIEASGKKYLDEIIGFHRLSADTTLAGRFATAAREETISYRINLSASIFFFLIAIILVVKETWSPSGGLIHAFSDPLFRWLGKVSLIAVCVVPAGIFASQAAKHRRAATWYKTIGVRIATLKPYLSEFEGDYQEQLREIIKSFFTSELNVERPRSANRMLSLKEIEALPDMLGSGPIDHLLAA